MDKKSFEHDWICLQLELDVSEGWEQSTVDRVPGPQRQSIEVASVGGDTY